MTWAAVDGATPPEENNAMSVKHLVSSLLFGLLLALTWPQAAFTDGEDSKAAANDAVIVAAENYAFVPAEVTVKVGTRMRWENRDRRQYHSVYFEQLGDEPGDYFFPGESRERVFDRPGSYPYVCEPHWDTHGMRGVVHVVE
jgi:plastocyanin